MAEAAVQLVGRNAALERLEAVPAVESHLRNLFRKLGVSSRADVARTIERADV